MPTHLKNAYTNVFFYDIALTSTNAFTAYVPGDSGRLMGWIDQVVYLLSLVYESVYVIKRAVGGTKLALPTNQGNSYPRSDFKSRSTDGRAVVVGLLPANSFDEINLWGQCETDGADITDAGNYQTNLTDWIAEFRGIGINNEWIIKRIGNLTKDFDYRSTIASAQDADATSSVFVIDSNNLRQLGTDTQNGEDGQGDFSHVAHRGAITIGTRFAEKVLQRFNRNKQDVTKPVIQTAVISSDGTTLTLTYNKILNSGVAPFWKQYTCGTKVWQTVVVSGLTVILTPTVPFYSGQTYTLSYTKNVIFNENLQDLQGNEVADLISYSLTNNASSSEPFITNLYTGDFSAGLDGTWAGSGNATASAPVTSTGGAVNCAKVLSTAASNVRFTKSSTSGVSAGHTYRIRFKIEMADVFGYPGAPTPYYMYMGQSPNTVISDMGGIMVRDTLTYYEFQWNHISGNSIIFIESGCVSGQFWFIKDVVIDKIGS